MRGEEITHRGDSAGDVRRYAALGAALLCFVALAAAWHFGPLAQWMNSSTLAVAGERIETLPLAPVVIIAVYLVAGFLVVPINILIAATILVFGPLHGMFYAYCGVLLSTALTYAAARRLGVLLPASFNARRVEPLRAYIAQRGWPAVFIVRVLPVAPFTVINTLAGASRIPLRPFLIGTALGMAPGIAGLAFFADRVIEAIAHPSPLGVATVAGLVLIVCALVVLARRFVAARWRQR
ncbi:MAG TPA: VTT domain-containing protein [Burkholderiales bacterium]|nr:VTT domain-containing protein [Burkholderiales bacterium]